MFVVLDLTWPYGSGMPIVVFFFQAEDGIRYWSVTGVQTCALPISGATAPSGRSGDVLGTFGAGVEWSPAPTRELAVVHAAEGDLCHERTDQRAEHVPRSEERRVGKECRSRGSPYH